MYEALSLAPKLLDTGFLLPEIMSKWSGLQRLVRVPNSVPRGRPRHPTAEPFPDANYLAPQPILLKAGKLVSNTVWTPKSVWNSGCATVSAHETPFWHQTCLIHPPAFNRVKMAWVAGLGRTPACPWAPRARPGASAGASASPGPAASPCLRRQPARPWESGDPNPLHRLQVCCGYERVKI